MRLFIAIDLTDEIRRSISDYISRLESKLPEAAKTKWVPAESRHITLKFIGESSRVDDIKSALARVQANSFQLSIRNIGFFTPRSPRIFWTGVDAPGDLNHLASLIDVALIPLGIPQEKKAYHPHITLARIGSGRPQGTKRDRNQPWLLGLKQAIDAHQEFANPDFGTMTPREFFLYRSETLPEGARYTKLAAFPLP
jgi:2'-5' RNA ligase